MAKKKVGEHLVPATPYRWWGFSPFDQAEDADSSFGTPTAAWGVSAAKAARSAAVSWSRRWFFSSQERKNDASLAWFETSHILGKNQHIYIYIMSLHAFHALRNFWVQALNG